MNLKYTKELMAFKGNFYKKKISVRADRKWDDLVEEHDRRHVEVKHKILEERNMK